VEKNERRLSGDEPRHLLRHDHQAPELHRGISQGLGSGGDDALAKGDDLGQRILALPYCTSSISTTCRLADRAGQAFRPGQGFRGHPKTLGRRAHHRLDQSLPALGQRRSRVVKIGAKVVRHGRYITFQLAEVAIPRTLFAEILGLIDGLRPAPLPP